MTKTFERVAKSFGMTNQMLVLDLLAIEKKYTLDNLVDIAREENESRDNYYLQFSHQLRNEAQLMAKQYELFYCLEKSIRETISDVLESAYGNDWWNATDVVPLLIHQDVEKNMKKEQDAGITPRSTDAIDYTTFGQLSEIIKSNWNVFGGLFNSVRAVEKVLSSLNTLRNPIAHCSALAEDEILRLNLSIRDWFRLSSQ